jgi:hypothetical protein
MNSIAAFESAVETALVSLPVVVCRIIAGYAYRKPHRWSSDGFDASTDSRWRLTAITDVETRFEYDGYSGLNWHKVVSETAIRDGSLTWTVVVDPSENVFVGVTTVDGNKLRTSGDTARQNSWMMDTFGDDIRIFNETECRCQRWSAPSIGYVRYRFAADPATRQVTATLTGHNSAIVLKTAATDEEFWKLRPSIDFIGNVDVQLISDL